MKIIDYTIEYNVEISELFTNTIHNICNKDYTKEQLNAWANPNPDYITWEKRLNKTQPYLAIIDDILVGFIEFYDEYIDCFYVHHEYQGKGVGKALMSYILEVASKNDTKILKVDASITAKQFFESFGFVQTSRNEVKRDNQVLINYSLALKLL
jgi:putative acetyltransferase